MLNTQTLNTLDEVRAFVEGTVSVDLRPVAQAERYRWLGLTLHAFGYAGLKRAEKGLLKRYLGKVTGNSQAQLNRLIAQWRAASQVQNLL